MKRVFLLGTAAIGLLFAACTKDEAVDQQPQPQPIATERIYLSDEATEAQAASDPATRAQFTGNSYKIAWEAGDEVALTTNQERYPVLQDDAGRWYVELPSADSYTVYYPAASKKIIYGGDTFELSTTQTYRAGTFDKQAFAARAVAKKGEKLTFKYMCSMLKLTLQGTASDKVSSIRIDALSDEVLSPGGEIVEDEAGVAYITKFTSNYATLSKSYVILNADPAVALTTEGVDFYLTMLPATFSHGFTVTVTLADGRVMTRIGGVGQSASRGKILTMPALKFAASPVAPVLYSTDNASWKLWEYTADGVTPATLTYPETTDHTLYFMDNAAAPTPGLTRAHLQSLADTFRSRDEATAQPIRLDMGQATLAGTTEFPSDVFCGAYWNGVVETADGDNALTGIVLPENTTRIADMSVTHALADRIGALSFNGALADVRLPEGISYIGSGAFTRCDAVKTFTIPGAEGDMTIGKYAFWAMDRTQAGTFEFRCERTTPPTLLMSGADTPFKDAAYLGGMIIRVPAASLAAYQADPSWQKVIAEGTARTWATF